PHGARDAVHDAPRELPGLPLPPERPERRAGRDAGREPRPERTARPDRLLLHHAGAARADRWPAAVLGPARRRARVDARRIRAPGAAVRAPRRSAAAGAQPRPLAALPGPVGPRDPAGRRRRARAARPRAAADRAAVADGEVRP